MTDYGKYINPIPVRNQAVKIITDAGNPSSNWLKAAAIQHWMKNNISYVPDPTSGEYVAKPDETLACRGGDCEDFSILFCSLCEAVGVRTKLYIASTDHSAHAFAVIYCDQGYPPTLTSDLQTFYAARGISITPIYTFNKGSEGIWLLVEPQDPHVGDIRGLIGLGFFASDSQGVRWSSSLTVYTRG